MSVSNQVFEELNELLHSPEPTTILIDKSGKTIMALHDIKSASKVHLAWADKTQVLSMGLFTSEGR